MTQVDWEELTYLPTVRQKSFISRAPYFPDYDDGTCNGLNGFFAA